MSADASADASADVPPRINSCLFLSNLVLLRLSPSLLIGKYIPFSVSLPTLVFWDYFPPYL